MDKQRSHNSNLQILERDFPKQLMINPVALLTYEVDAANDRGSPDGVFFPETAEDVEKVVRWASQHGVALVARGAGTGLSGGAVAEHGGLIVEFSRFNRMLEFDRPGRSIQVEPGLVNLKLDEYVKTAGLYFPPDPASGRSATLGGNLAENAGGPHCFKYGVMTNYVTGLEVVLANGIQARLGGPATDYPEYDFKSVLIGSEGTLGIIVRAWLRLLRNPPGVKTMMAAFNTVEAAGQAVSAIIACGLVPATMEFMDQRMMRIIEDYAHAGLPLEAGAALIIEVDGYPESLDVQMAEIVEILQSHAAFNLRVAQSKEERERIWYGRKSAAGAMARLSPAYYLLDGTVPRSRLAETLSEVNRVCASLELRVAYVFHAGDGNLHPFILIEEPYNPDYMQRIHQAGEQIMQICIDRQGSITGEHGVGIEKRRFMPLMYNRDELAAMQDLKRVFDPSGLFNPGKIFPDSLPSGNSSEGVSIPTRVNEMASSQILREYAPKGIEEAASLIRTLVGEGTRIRLRGGGTKSGLLPQEDCLITTKTLTGVRAFAPADLYVTVQAGMLLSELQESLLPDRMWAPLASPWMKSTIGGMLATNFNGPLRMRYGGLRDLLLAAKVVLPDGRVVRLGRPVVKNVAGYDLHKLFVGAHGTLGLVAEVTLKVAPLPRLRRSLIIPVEDLSTGLKIGQDLLPVCLTASALILVSHSHANSGNELLSAAGGLPYSLVYTAEGQPEDVIAELNQVRQVLRHRGTPDSTSSDGISGTDLWGEWLGEKYAGGGVVLRYGVPAGCLAQFGNTLPLDGAIMVDFASGLVWLAPSTGTDNGGLHVVSEKAYEQQGYAVLLAGSTIDNELEVNLARRPGSLEWMRKLKTRWDPQMLVNPNAFPYL